MSDLERMDESWPTDAERALLRAGANEAPPRRALRRTLAAVAASGTVLGAGTPAAGAAMAASLTWKVVALSGLVVGIGVGAMRWHSHATHGTAVPATAEPAPHAIVGAPLEAVAQAPPSAMREVEPAVDSRTSAPSPVAIHPAKSSASPKTSAAADLPAEVAALDAARQALAAGNAGDALRRIGLYERDFPGGVLREEATVLRIEALLRRGDRAGARALATRFLAMAPSSTHATRIRSLLNEASRGP